MLATDCGDCHRGERDVKDERDEKDEVFGGGHAALEENIV
jgi:hypothetical protein